MKRIRYLFIILMCAFFTSAEAGDTLTRAQVYNFNVGDTFDYRIHNWSSGPGPPNGDIVVSDQVSYSRFIVTNIYWSSDTQTKYIIRNQVYPPIGLDTLVLSNLTGYEVILDSIAYYESSWPDTFVISGEPNYFGKEVNSLTYFCCSPGYESIFFANALGAAITNHFGWVLSDRWNDSTLLIYYSGGSGTFGIPYTSLLPSKEDISIYPSPNTGVFTVETQNETHLPFDFSIYDLQGEKVFELMLNDYSDYIYMNSLSNGLYIWMANADGKSLQTGKLIIQH